MKIETHEALKAAGYKLADARRALQRAQFSLTKAKNWEAKKLEAVTACKADVEAADKKPAYRAATEALSSAEVDHLLAAKDTKAKQVMHDRAAADVAQADVAVHAEVLRIINAEAIAIAAELESHLDKAAHLAVKLRGYQPDPWNTPVNELHTLPPAIERALNRIPEAQSGIHTPVSSTMTHNKTGEILAMRRQELLNSVLPADEPLEAA